MTAPHWSLRNRWARSRKGTATSSKPGERRRTLADMSSEELAAHEVKKAQARERRAAAFAAMTLEQRAEYERAIATARAHERAPALVDLAAWVDALPLPGDLPLNPRERPQRQSEANMLGVRLLDLPRDKGARALVLLREWNGLLRLHFLLVFVDAQGRPVRSFGWTLRLYEAALNGGVVPSTRELEALTAMLVDLRLQLLANDPVLMTSINGMREGRERLNQGAAALRGGAMKVGD
jgi:hypothetical protein